MRLYPFVWVLPIKPYPTSPIFNAFLFSIFNNFFNALEKYYLTEIASSFLSCLCRSKASALRRQARDDVILHSIHVNGELPPLQPGYHSRFAAWSLCH